MTVVKRPRQRTLAAVIATIVAAAILAGPRPSWAQSLGELNQRLDALEPQVAEAQTNASVASSVISQLDTTEADFAKIAEQSHASRDTLLNAYDRLERMLDRLYSTYSQKKDACIQTINNGGNCDYEQPEQLALRALYPLSWLRFEGATLYHDEPAMSRRLLNQAIDGFTDSTLLILSPELIRENLLGRAFAERELGKFDRSEYTRAIADFKQIMRAGPETRQYRAAEQGLSTTYAAMGNLNAAQGLNQRLAAGASGEQRQGLEMLRLRELYKQEAAASDPVKRAELHRQIIDFARTRADDQQDWAIVVAATADNVPDPIAEFGDSHDPFVNWLLANVLYYKHQSLAAAKYYWAAAQSGRYTKAYKYAADLYYTQGRLDMVAAVAHDIARQPGNPDAQWASYMLYKIPRLEWERGGMRNADLENRWAAAAQDYLKNYPHGQYAFEPRFRLGELYQRKGQYQAAAEQYEQVNGNPDYTFTARYNAAECYYHALNDKSSKPAPAAAAPATADKAQLRERTIAALSAAIKLEPSAERGAAASQRAAIRGSRGRAVYMLATLLEQEPTVDYRRVADTLAGFEQQFPAMSAHFKQTYEWRVEALDRSGQYAELEREAAALAANHPLWVSDDYIKQIGLDYWNSANAKRAHNDQAGYLQDVKLTAITYDYFARRVEQGQIPAKNLTGTLSILGQSDLALDQTQKAEALFTEVVKADPGSPDANAGLARIAQARKDYRDALDLWSRVESLAAQSDALYYESKYNMADILAAEGNVTGACNKLAVTRNEHPTLGSPEMKQQWGELQDKLCRNRTEG